MEKLLISFNILNNKREINSKLIYEKSKNLISEGILKRKNINYLFLLISLIGIINSQILNNKEINNNNNNNNNDILEFDLIEKNYSFNNSKIKTNIKPISKFSFNSFTKIKENQINSKLDNINNYINTNININRISLNNELHEYSKSKKQ